MSEIDDVLQQLQALDQSYGQQFQQWSALPQDVRIQLLSGEHEHDGRDHDHRDVARDLHRHRKPQFARLFEHDRSLSRLRSVANRPNRIGP